MAQNFHANPQEPKSLKTGYDINESNQNADLYIFKQSFGNQSLYSFPHLGVP